MGVENGGIGSKIKKVETGLINFVKDWRLSVPLLIALISLSTSILYGIKQNVEANPSMIEGGLLVGSTGLAISFGIMTKRSINRNWTKDHSIAPH